MSDSDKNSVAKMILQSVEDFATIVKGETNFSREAVKELSGDYVLFKFSKNIS